GTGSARPRPAANLHPAARRPADSARPGGTLSAANGQPTTPVVPQLDVRQHQIAAGAGRRADHRDPSPRRSVARYRARPVGTRRGEGASRGSAPGQWVRVYNDRGSFRAMALVGETVKRGVVVTQGIWWNVYTPDHVNCNTTTSSRLTDLGGGATFFDNLVQVRRAEE